MTNGSKYLAAAIDQAIIQVTEEYNIGQAQQAAKAMAHLLGLTKVTIYSIATAVSELANNLFFHARHGGVIRLYALRRDGEVGVEVIAEDDGPGIADIELALQDGFTTNGGLGGGLAGVRRLMDEFEIKSSSGMGTLVRARKWERCR